ncbi:hypothetical protein PPL_02982 [Heterostelium album PN500]|uniref:G domain-containing protein n=1 Tax=Heterostelium pallidum (strain ATCC 26659 / Pp 5 / PN500) TaxID=670386 RepID=D3B3L4_HETP5|nr:hypothetical protein PPL_02982 [Heterostelium album PN500]EFA83912.1 hypothetical protein PPL_02982 [Heterostelium album PN500]|eukprot:XP_020436029.1 hypothetical protein PPL_02982 [Heterostelium album PN500]
MNSNPNYYLVFLGNPGTGKSSICNCLCGQLKCKSGNSSGTGLTTQSQIIENGDYTIIDTPGLRDPQSRKQAAKEISNSLKLNGYYKLIFVTTLESGRVYVDDIETINVILKSLSCPIKYGIILNKITPNVHRKILENSSVLSCCWRLLGYQPCASYILKNFDHMKDNTALIEDQTTKGALKQFIDSIPTIYIDESMVGEIDIRDYEEKVSELELRFGEMQKQLTTQIENNQELTKRTDDLGIILEKEREDAKETQLLGIQQLVKLQEKFSEDQKMMAAQANEMMIRQMEIRAEHSKPIIIDGGNGSSGSFSFNIPVSLPGCSSQ